MLNIEYPKLEKKTFNGLELSINEPKTKINLRGKKKDFFTKAGKILSLILPVEANTSSSNEKFNALWLSPDEWLIYFDDDDKNGKNETQDAPVATRTESERRHAGSGAIAGEARHRKRENASGLDRGETRRVRGEVCKSREISVGTNERVGNG